MSYRAQLSDVRNHLDELSRDVATRHASFPAWEGKHRGKDFKRWVLPYVAHIDALEWRYTQPIYTAAAQITHLCTLNKDWSQDNDILALWHHLADKIVTRFSHHPDLEKGPVATLIINTDGVLQAFSANRTPEGIKRRAAMYVDSKDKKQWSRKDVSTPCSERCAMARLFGVMPPFTIPQTIAAALKNQTHGIEKWQIEEWNKAIIAAAPINPTLLKDSFILTTVTPCDRCATCIAPHRPQAILTCENTGNNFTLKDTHAVGRRILQAAGIEIRHINLG